MRKHKIKRESKVLLDLDCSDDLSVLDEYMGKIRNVCEVLRVQVATIALKIKAR